MVLFTKKTGIQGETRRRMFLVHTAHRVFEMAIFGNCPHIMVHESPKVKQNNKI